MRSVIADALKLSTSPVGIRFSETLPEGAMQSTRDQHSCVIALLNEAVYGKTTAITREHGCGGGQVGLGLCNTPSDPPGGMDYFLSTGRGPGFIDGEGYKKTPEIAREYLANQPMVQIPTPYVVMQPLTDIADDDPTLQSIVFLVNADQLAALVVLANYDRVTNDAVTIAQASGCQSIGILTYQEAAQTPQRAIVGLMDITARKHIKAGYLTFSMPVALFHTMEANVHGSFLEKSEWRKIRARLPEKDSYDPFESHHLIR